MESVYSYVYTFGSTVMLRLININILISPNKHQFLTHVGFFSMKMSNIDDLSVSSLMDLKLARRVL